MEPTRVLSLPIMTSAPFTMTLENGQKIHLKSGASIQEDFDRLPVLDLADLNSQDLEKRKALSKELYKVCSEVGFFYVINHNIPKDIMDDAFKMSKEFFALPVDEKMSVYTGLAPVEQYTGYHPMGTYNKGLRKYNDLYEAFNWNYDPVYDPVTPPKEKAARSVPNMWPKPLPKMQDVMMKYDAECLKLGRKLIGLVALAFGLEEEYFDDAVQAPASGSRIVHYPIQKESEEDQNGISPHTDFQTLTFVNTGDISGLQVINKRGQWIEAPPLAGALVVNVGDCLMRITNDKFVSTVHRVVNMGSQERFSIPYFFGFDYDYKLAPVPGCTSDEDPFKYPVVTSAEYVEWRGKTAKLNGEKLAKARGAKA